MVALHTHLDAERFESALLTGRLDPGEADLSPLARSSGVPLETVPGLAARGGLLDDVRAAWWLYQRFRRDRPDIVHTHTAKAGAVGRIAAALAGVPVRIHTFHGHVLGGSYFSATRTAAYRFVEQVLARLTHRFVALSEGQVNELADTHGVAPRERFTTIPLGLDLEAFVTVDRRSARASLLRELGVRDERPLVAIVGRVVPVKNHALLFRACALLRRQGRPVRVLVVGGGEHEWLAGLQDVVRRLGLDRDVHWLGWRSDVATLQAASDVLALPSHDEGTPVAIIEALAAGTPVVARAVGGVPEMLLDSPRSSLVESARPDAFAAGLERTLSEPALTEGVLQTLRRDTAARYARPRLAADTASLYEDELARAGWMGGEDSG